MKIDIEIEIKKGKELPFYRYIYFTPDKQNILTSSLKYNCKDSCQYSGKIQQEDLFIGTIFFQE